MRLDAALVQHGLVSGREKAKAVIASGCVLVNKKVADKASTQVEDTDILEVLSTPLLQYVSRGGLKLEKAIAQFSISLQGKVCVDIGASTGGFTDCMLQNGAKKVYAVDVGTAQLASSLMADSRVINLEHTNARELTASHFAEPVDFISTDVSFISLSYMFPVITEILPDGKTAVCLIKPQFEAGKENIGKNGVVKSSKVHNSLICRLIQCCQQNGCSVLDIAYSPVKGPMGNIEYLLYIQKEKYPQPFHYEKISAVVKQAFLNKF